jgi:hypothetical protein
MIKTLKEAVFKRPISLFWPERVRKLLTPVLGNRPSTELEAVLAHGPERSTKRVGPRIPDGHRAVFEPFWDFRLPVLRAVLGFSAKHSQKQAATRFENGTQPVFKAVLAHGPERPTKRAGSRFHSWQRAVLGPVLGFSFARAQGRFRIMCQTLKNGRQPVSKTRPSPFWWPSSNSLKNPNFSSLLSLNAIRERVGPSDKVSPARWK